MEKAFSELEQLGPSDLIAYINDCIQHDFNKLVQLLYRIDVSEEKLKYILQLRIEHYTNYTSKKPPLRRQPKTNFNIHLQRGKYRRKI